MITLHIDTSDNKKTKVGLTGHGNDEFIERESQTWKSQMVLPMLHELLQKHNVDVKSLQAIEVHEGPGSFTGLRVGAAIANVLGTWLNIPVNKKNVGEIVEPKYQ